METSRHDQSKLSSVVKPNRYATWIIGLSPLIALAGIVWFLILVSTGQRGPTNYVITLMTFGGILTGTIGGLSMANIRKNGWWLVVTAASVGVGCLLVLVGYGVGLGRMH